MMNLAYQMLTRTGLSFWEVTSAMQNSIRKGDYEIAGFCLWELLPQYTPYLRKRLLVISAEDCYGVITKEILNLCESKKEQRRRLLRLQPDVHRHGCTKLEQTRACASIAYGNPKKKHCRRRKIQCGAFQNKPQRVLENAQRYGDGLLSRPIR